MNNLITRSQLENLQQRQIAMGFDGFVDTIVRLIRAKENNGVAYFERMKEFGEYTLEKSGTNFSIEVTETVKKIGGNMPIMANAMAAFGPSIHCIGAFGYPEILPVFHTMRPNCSLTSFAEPGITTAIEFNDGKIILGEMEKISAAGWTQLCSAISIHELVALFNTCDLIAILNWSELDPSTEIWRGLLREVLPRTKRDDKPFGFFDLSDCSKRGATAIREALDMIREFALTWNVSLSLNLNEARLIYSTLTGNVSDNQNATALGRAIFDVMHIDTVVIHSGVNAWAWHAGDMVHVESERIERPFITTGAGDNFNAGYCIGLLAGMTTTACLQMGHDVAREYMQGNI